VTQHRPPDQHDGALPEDLLSAYVDGELDDATRTAVDARLAESAEWRAVLADVQAARDAVRSLPLRDAPDGFWERLLASDDAPDGPDQGSGGASDSTVVDLGAARAKRRRAARFVAFAASAAAAIVIVAVAVVPSQDRVKPAVATFTNAHAVRSSVGNDVVSNVAGEAVPGGVGR
jgi:anti-sigma factor RsiW